MLESISNRVEELNEFSLDEEEPQEEKTIELEPKENFDYKYELNKLKFYFTQLKEYFTEDISEIYKYDWKLISENARKTTEKYDYFVFMNKMKEYYHNILKNNGKHN